MKKQPKKPNPQDSTLRNIRAAKKRIAVIEVRVYRLERALAALSPKA